MLNYKSFEKEAERDLWVIEDEGLRNSYLFFSERWDEIKTLREEIKQLDEKYLSFIVEILNEVSKPYEYKELYEKTLRFVIKIAENIINKVERGELLSLEDIKNITCILQPGYLPGQEKYSERLEQALKSDVARKALQYGKEVIRELLSLKEIERAKNIKTVERIRKYIIAECGLEFGVESLQLDEKVMRCEMGYEEYVRRMNDLYENIYSWCPGSQEEFDFVKAGSIPFSDTPRSRKAYEYYKRVIEPDIKRMAQREAEKLEEMARKFGLL